MISKVLVYFFVASAVGEQVSASVLWHHVHRKPVASLSSRFVYFDDIFRSIAVSKPEVRHEPALVENCGQAPLAPDTLSTIVGGKEAIPHSYPWQVGLLDDDYCFCSGSLISDQWIVTAAHCLYRMVNVTAVLGAHDIRANEPSQVKIESLQTYLHEGWSHGKHEDDIALIKLQRKVHFNDYIQPICLPEEGSPEVAAGMNVTVTGWGNMHGGEFLLPKLLQEVTIPVLSNDECGDFLPGLITDDMICTDGSSIKGPCHGDSGGPMNYKTEAGVELRGIVSFGSTLGCEKGQPDAFTRVSHYVKWIREITGLNL